MDHFFFPVMYVIRMKSPKQEVAITLRKKLGNKEMYRAQYGVEPSILIRPALYAHACRSSLLISGPTSMDDFPTLKRTTPQSLALATFFLIEGTTLSTHE